MSAHDQALAALAEVDALSAQIGRLKSSGAIPNRDGLLRSANARLGIALKSAEVYATLAVAEAVESLRGGRASGLDLALGFADAKSAAVIGQGLQAYLDTHLGRQS